MSGDIGRPGGLSSATEPQASRPSRASIPDAQYKAMRRLCDPMMKVLHKMTGEEIALAMQGFYATSESNCPWYAYSLRHAMPPLLATIGLDRPGYQEAFSAQAIEARSVETEGLDPKDESAVRQDAPSPCEGTPDDN